jgi:hypothetical protein
LKHGVLGVQGDLFHWGRRRKYDFGHIPVNLHGSGDPTRPVGARFGVWGGEPVGQGMRVQKLSVCLGDFDMELDQLEPLGLVGRRCKVVVDGEQESGDGAVDLEWRELDLTLHRFSNTFEKYFLRRVAVLDFFTNERLEIPNLLE